MTATDEARSDQTGRGPGAGVLAGHVAAAAIAAGAYLVLAGRVLGALTVDLAPSAWVGDLAGAAVAFVVFLGLAWRTLGYVLPARVLGLEGARSPGLAANRRFGAAARSADADGVADHLDALRQVRVPTPRDWRPDADASREDRAEADRRVQEIRRRTRRRFAAGVLASMAAAASGLGLYWVATSGPGEGFGGPRELFALGFVAGLGPLQVVLFSTMAWISVAWVRWYRDHVRAA